MIGGRDPFCTGREDAIHPGKNRVDGLSCRQQDRVIFPVIKGVAQESDGGQDLGQFQTSVTGVISRPGGGKQGHQQGCRITLCKCDGIDRRGAQAHLNGGGGRHGTFHTADRGVQITNEKQCVPHDET